MLRRTPTTRGGLALTLAIAVAGAAATTEAKAADVETRWIQLVPSVGCVLKTDAGASGAVAACPVTFMAKAVVKADTACPQVTVRKADGRPAATVSMNHRMVGADLPAFQEIKVCQAAIEPPVGGGDALIGDATPVSLAASLSTTDGPRRIAIVGDTGCRNDSEQSCDPKSWPFAEVAAGIASDEPDLAIHVGDYMYDWGGDTWKGWKKYFFDPAGASLATAPWIMMRGNHEGCGFKPQGPRGYEIFFSIDGADCGKEIASSPKPKFADPNALDATYALDIAGDLRVVVHDSAIAYSATGVECQAGTQPCENTRKAFVHAQALSLGDRTVWLATHIPAFTVVWEKNASTGAWDPAFPGGAAMMLALWRELGPDMPRVSTIVSGHRHLFEALKADPPRPWQVISGAGGVNQDGTPAGFGKTNRSAPPAGQTWTSGPGGDDPICSLSAWGHITAEQTSGGWDMSLRPIGKGVETGCDDQLP